MKYFYVVTILIFSLWISACTNTSVDSAQLYKGQSEEQIFRDGEQSLSKHQYEDAIHHFETLNARYPFGKFAEQSSLNLVYAYYKSSNTPNALAEANRYIRLYPRNPSVDYAYYMKGLVQLNENLGFFERYFTFDYAKRDLSNLRKAYVDFNHLVRYFPKSKYTPDARQQMIYIRNTLARHELQVAQFYYDHEAFVAAANRASNVVRHYQETPSVPEALKLMVKSYQKLGLTKEANDTSQVLQLNFPDSKKA
jgi:outer membrane protein assembly factor BamD